VALQLEDRLHILDGAGQNATEEALQERRGPSQRPAEGCRHVVLISAEKVEDRFYGAGVKD
jgi:hypothetical protein